MLEMHRNAIILISTTNHTSSYNFSCLDLIVTTEEKKNLRARAKVWGVENLEINSGFQTAFILFWLRDSVLCMPNK